MKYKIWVVVLAVVVGGGLFYGGTVYGKSGGAVASSRSRFQQFSRGQFASSSAMGNFGGRGGGGMVAGQVLSSDSQGVTVKLPTGGTKLVFVSTSTKVSKTVDAAPSDLATGTNIVVQGTSNSDGSVTASTVEIRPAGSDFGMRNPAAAGQSQPQQPQQTAQ
ncbi:MAG TPA: hypothetical protein VFM02_03580 [Candidatus Paceibacterota bacterium]|nr:hypothetical protein [Candidatus Paceibacterota bacterium]